MEYFQHRRQLHESPLNTSRGSGDLLTGGERKKKHCPASLSHLETETTGRPQMQPKDFATSQRGDTWRQDLERLKPYENELTLLPVGWGIKGKAPMLKAWQHHQGFTIEELRQTQGIRSVGAITGRHAGRLLCFDFDGESAIRYGKKNNLFSDSTKTWQIHRTTSSFHLKVIFRVNQEQLNELDSTDGFQLSIPESGEARDKTSGRLEIFFQQNRQVIVLGEHPSTGGQYFWPSGRGPEDLAPAPSPWWDFAVRAHRSENRFSKSRIKTHSMRATKNTRVNPCPICGRHDGPGGSQLWCSKEKNGLLFCMPGSTFSADKRHGVLKPGQVVNGWILLKRTPTPKGVVLTFKGESMSALLSIRASLKAKAEGKK